MDYDKIKYIAYNFYVTNNIKKLPFNCIDVILGMGYKLKKYSDLSDVKSMICMELSEDACTIDNTICYNDNMGTKRIRFSLMHEIGHILLDTNSEAEANSFASNVLVPSMAIHYSHLNNIREIANLFNVSLECAEYAYENYERWYYSVKKYGMSDIDKKLYDNFYNEEYRMFVFKEYPCTYCDAMVLNSNKPFCEKCNKPLTDNSIFNKPSKQFLFAEYNWLYGNEY